MNEHGVRNKFSPRVAVIAPEDPDGGLTQQHFKEAVDINNILAKYRKTGIMEHVKLAKERYGDFTELGEYAVHLDKVAKAQQAFESLPAELRNQFNNSIPGFFEYVMKEENYDQCVKWGIFDPKEPKAGTPAAADPAPQATKSGSMKKPKVTPESSTGDEA